MEQPRILIPVVISILLVLIAVVGAYVYHKTTDLSPSHAEVNDQDMQVVRLPDSERSRESTAAITALKARKLEQVHSAHQSRLDALAPSTAYRNSLDDLSRRIGSLPEPTKLLQAGGPPEFNQVGQRRSKLDSPEWQSVMSNYERETGISRYEIESLLRRR